MQNYTIHLYYFFLIEFLITIIINTCMTDKYYNIILLQKLIIYYLLLTSRYNSLNASIIYLLFLRRIFNMFFLSDSIVLPSFNYYKLPHLNT